MPQGIKEKNRSVFLKTAWRLQDLLYTPIKYIYSIQIAKRSNFFLFKNKIAKNDFVLTIVIFFLAFKLSKVFILFSMGILQFDKKQNKQTKQNKTNKQTKKKKKERKHPFS